MKQTKELQQDESPIICFHCHREINTAKIIGMSIVCPICGKPSNESYIKETAQT